MPTDPVIERFAARLLRIERELKAQKSPQLAHSTIVDGAVYAYDDATETQTMQIGLQYDGSNVAAPLVGPTPPIPTAPAVVTAGTEGATFAWNGQFIDALVAPMDFSRVDVHVGATDEVDDTYPIAGSIMTARGGHVFVGLAPGTYFAVFVTRAQTGKPSPVSDVVEFTIAAPTMGSDGLPPPELDTAPLVTGGPGSLFVSHAGVDNPDGRPVKYAVHVAPITEGATDFDATPANRVGYMESTFKQVTTLADGSPLPYGTGYNKTLNIFELSLLASGQIGVFTAGSFDQTPQPGDMVTIEGTGLTGVDGSWPVTGAFSSAIFTLQGTHSEPPASGITLPDDMATLNIPGSQRYGVKIWPEDADGPTADPSPMGSGVVRRTGTIDLDAGSVTADKLVVNSQLVGEIMAQAIESTLVRSADSGARWEGDFRGLRIYGPDGELKINLPTFSEDPDDPLTATFKGQGWFESLGVANNLSVDGQDNTFNKGSKFWLLSGATRPSSAPAAVSGWNTRQTHLGFNPGGFFPFDPTTFVHAESAGTANLAMLTWDAGQNRYAWAAGNEIRTTGATSPDTYNAIGGPVVAFSGKIFIMVTSRTPMNAYKNYWRAVRLAWDAPSGKFVYEAKLNFQPLGTSSVHGANGDYDGTMFYDHEHDRVMYLGINGNGDTNVWEINQSSLAASLFGGGSAATLRLATTGAGTVGSYWKPGRAIVGAVMMGNGASAVSEVAERATTLYNKSGTTITVTTSQPHGFATGMSVRMSAAPFHLGALQVVSVPSPTTFVVSSSAGVAGTQPYTGTVAPTRMLWTVRDSGVIVDAWAWNGATNDFINAPLDSFPIPTAGTDAFVWDPAALSGTGGFRTRQGASVIDHTRMVWTGDTATWWFTHSLYDPNVTGGTHETEMAAPRQLSVLKRSRVVVTPPPLPARPIPNTDDDPTHARLYISRNQYGAAPHTPSRTEFDRFDELAGTTLPFQSIIEDLPAFLAAPANTPPASNTFTASAPAEFLVPRLVPTTSAGAGPLVQAPALLKGDGDSWLDPVGAFREFHGTQVDGWLLCNGQAISRTDFPLLFARFGTAYGVGDGSTTFNLPVMNGTDAAWTALTLANGTPANSPGVKMESGFVIARGGMTHNAGAGSTAMTTFPTGYRPSTDLHLPTGSSAGGASVRTLATSGSMVLFTAAAGNATYTLVVTPFRPETWKSCTRNVFVRAA